MKKLLLFFLLLPYLAISQTTPLTLSFRGNTPVNALDTFAYTYPGKIGGYGWLYNAAFIRTNYAKKSNSYNYATPLAFNTPTLHDATVIETSSGMVDANTIEQFYHIGSVDTVIYRRTANNALLNNWTSGVAVTGATGLFPYVFYNGSTRYMLSTSSDLKRIHMYTSANGTSWTVMNGGSPVVVASSTSTDYNFLLFNPGACIVNGQVHILVEGNAESGSLVGKGLMGYAVAPLSAPVFTLSPTYVMPGGNAQLLYVPERNSIVALYSTVDVTVSPIDLRLKTATASLSSDLTKLASWSTGFQLFPNLGKLTADADLVFTPGKTYSAMMFYSKEQAEGYVTYTDLAPNTLQLYNSVAQYEPYKDPLVPIAPNGVNSTGPLNFTKNTAATNVVGSIMSNGGGSNGSGVYTDYNLAGARASSGARVTGANESLGAAYEIKTSSNTSGATDHALFDRDKSTTLYGSLTSQTPNGTSATDSLVVKIGSSKKYGAIPSFNTLGDARYPQLGGSYANPSWITSLPWSKITSPPTTLSGYGITDAAPISSVLWARTSSVLNPINSGDKLEIVANGISAINIQASTGTAPNGMQVANGTGASYIFTEGSVGGTITGSNPYATVIGAGANKDLQLMTNATVRATISGAGVMDVPNLTTTTQTANDNSTKVATTAYVDAKILSTTSVYDFPSVPAGNNSSFVINSFTGVAVGDICLVTSASQLTGGNYTLKAIATATDTVTVYFDNNHTTAIDLGSQTYYVKVLK